MKVTLVQADLKWEDPGVNRDCLHKLINSEKDTDLVIIPEMFTTGFTMRSTDLAEDARGETLTWMHDIARKGDFGLAGSFIFREDKNYYNRLIFMKPDGSYSSYDKGHLFRMEKEDLYYQKGDNRLIEHFRGVNVNFQICYDLRFPVWSRNRDNEYDLLVYVANWPETRRKVWKTLLIARAIENQCFVAGVNRIGSDGKGICYSGDSVVIDPKGNKIAKVEPYSEGVTSVEISIDYLNTFRQKFPAWKDADNFSL
ncbi:MAG TPA: amidohydrolase [Bacteroidales bacterium]|nr:amidohydrolase [Bacteroidales bacterium]